MTDLTHIEQIITRALLEGCDNHKTRAQIARETARQVMGVAPRQNDFLRRMAIFFDRDATAGPFCAEDGDGGFVAAAERMAREIDRLRATLSAARDAPAQPVVKVKPEWRCFHCDEVFTSEREAREHFGFDPCLDPACRIKMGAERSMLTALRRAEKDAADAWQAIHNETTDAAKAYWNASVRHQEQLQAAEILGYERGLEDARREASVLPTLEPEPSLSTLRGEALEEAELSGISGELIDLVAEAIRADGSDLCDGAWAAVPEPSKMWWREDAVRALNALINARPVVKDFLTTTTPPLARETARQVVEVSRTYSTPDIPLHVGHTTQPYAWEWSQLMHDSMGGWEQKLERGKPGGWVRPEDIKELKPLYEHPSPSYDDGIKEGLRRAAALVREKHIVHVSGAMDLLEPRGDGNRSGLAYADAIEALSLLPKEEER